MSRAFNDDEVGQGGATYSTHGSRRPVAAAPVVSERGVPVKAPPLGPSADGQRDVAAHFLAELTSPNSRRAAAQGLERALRMLGEVDADVHAVAWWRLTRVHLQVLRRELKQAAYAASTINVTLTAVRGVAKVCLRLRLLDGADYQQIAEVKGVRPETNRLPGRLVGRDELRQLFRSCREDADAGDPAGPRDAALLGLLCLGLRRDEVAQLTMKHLVHLDEGELDEVGKGGARRTVFMPERLVVALCDWLDIRGDGPGWLWSRVRKGGHLVLPATGLSAAGVFAVCKRRAEQASLDETLSPQDLRRTFLSNLLDDGADLVTVQRLVGHRSPATTLRYDRRLADKAKAAALGIDAIDY